MSRWVEIAGSSPPKKRLDTTLPDDPAEDVVKQERWRAMTESRQAPSPAIWNPAWSKVSLGYEVDSRAKWEAEKKRRGLVEFSRSESLLDKQRDLKAELRKSARKAAEEALREVKQGARPAPLPSAPAPTPPPPLPREPESLPLEEVEALARDKSLDSDRPHPGFVSQMDLVADMKRRHGW